MARRDQPARNSAHVPIDPAVDLETVSYLHWRDRAFVFRAFIFVERRQDLGIFEPPGFALYPVVRLVRRDGGRITAEIEQLALCASSSYKSRPIREHAREFVVGAAPESSVDEQVMQSLFGSQRLFQLARVAIHLL